MTTESQEVLVTEEPIRRFPVWAARFMNKVIHWTDLFCSGSCGRPVTGQFQTKIDEIDNIPVFVSVCSVGSLCEKYAREKLETESYAEIRPSLVRVIKENSGEIRFINIGSVD